MSELKEVEGLTPVEGAVLEMLARQHSVVRCTQEKHLGVWTAAALVDALVELSTMINELQDQLADLAGEDQL